MVSLILLLLLLSSPAEAHEPDKPVILRFAGDCLLAGYYEDAVGTNAGLAFQDFDLLKTADVAMVNLECPVTTRGKKIPKPYNFRMNPRFLAALNGAGIDIVNIANNHIYDFGPEGLFDTISYLDSVGIRHVGAGRNRAEAHCPVVLNLNGIKVGFLGYYGGGEAPAASDLRPGVARRDIGLITSDIASLRYKDSVDYIVVNLHWGTEKETYPDGSQRDLAHRIIDSGADAVIGHHPHVLQGIELYKSGVIAYSLGNFIFGGNGRSTYDTGLFEIRLLGKSKEYSFIPIRIEGWKAARLAGSEGEIVEQRVRKLSSGFARSIFTQ